MPERHQGGPRCRLMGLPFHAYRLAELSLWQRERGVLCESPVWNSDTTVVADRFKRRDDFPDNLADPMAERRSCFKTEVWIQQSEIRARLLCWRVPTEPLFVAKA